MAGLTAAVKARMPSWWWWLGAFWVAWCIAWSVWGWQEKVAAFAIPFYVGVGSVWIWMWVRRVRRARRNSHTVSGSAGPLQLTATWVTMMQQDRPLPSPPAKPWTKPEVPDGLPMLGYRQWAAFGDDLLVSQYDMRPWPLRGPREASCGRGRGLTFPPQEDDCTDPPSPGQACTCGLYVNDRGDRRIGNSAGGALYGVMQGWGRYQRHSHGFRFQFGRPVALFLPWPSTPRILRYWCRVYDDKGHAGKAWAATRAAALEDARRAYVMSGDPAALSLPVRVDEGFDDEGELHERRVWFLANAYGLIVYRGIRSLEEVSNDLEHRRMGTRGLPGAPPRGGSGPDPRDNPFPPNVTS